MVVNAEAMRANLDITGGLIVSAAVMMGLAPHLGREAAHLTDPARSQGSSEAFINRVLAAGGG